MSATFTQGNAEQAEAWVKVSTFSEAEQNHLQRFIRRFPELEFFKQTLAEDSSAWLNQQVETLGFFGK